MKELNLRLPQEKAPLYIRIMAAVRGAIESGQIVAGERVPGVRELAQRLDVNRNTVSRAMEELVAEGWLQSRARSGYFAANSPPSRYTLRRPGRKPQTPVKLRRHEWPIDPHSDALPRPFAPYTPLPGSIWFGGSAPDVRLLPLSELRHCLRAATQANPAAVFGYGDAIGYGPFIDAMTEYLRRVCGITGRKIIVTSSSMEACLMISQLLLGPGKTVAMEELCFPPIYHQFRLSGANVLPLRLDDDGVIPDDLESLAKKRAVALLYLTPLHQYPTTATLTAARRKEVYAICEEHGIPILEDDYDHEFHYRMQPPAPIAGADPAELVLYVSTLSKSLFPSAKLGVLAVPEQLYLPLLSIRRATTFHTGNFLQAALAQWIEEGGFERHIKRMRAIYELRMLHLSARLAALQGSDPALKFRQPAGGLALWLDTGRNATEVEEYGRTLGVGLTAEDACRISSKRGGRHLKLGFGCLSIEELNLGVDLLAEALRGVPYSPRRMGFEV